MKIVITAKGTESSSGVDPRFGRAKYLVLADTERGTFSAQDNALNLNAAQGAGIQAAQNVAALGAEAVLTGNVGPKALRTLQAADIKVYLCDGEQTVAEALAAFQNGSLPEAASANVQGHW